MMSCRLIFYSSPTTVYYRMGDIHRSTVSFCEVTLVVHFPIEDFARPISWPVLLLQQPAIPSEKFSTVKQVFWLLLTFLS